MDLREFEFKRERKLGEFVQDFIDLLKVIFPHLSQVLLKLLVIPVCVMMLVGYYISTQLNLNIDYSSGELVSLLSSFSACAILLVVVGVLAFGLSIEYFIILRDRRDLDFTQADVWSSFVAHKQKYFYFILGSIVVCVMIVVPVCIALFISVFIPLVGTLLAGLIFSILGLWFFTAFMLYRENYYDLVDSYTSAFKLLKSKIMEYGIASYIVTFIFRSLITLVTLIPTVIIGLLAYNFVGLTDNFFDTFYGKLVVTLGTSLISVFFIIYYMLSVLSYGIIYETAKELKYGENLFERISNIGRSPNV